MKKIRKLILDFDGVYKHNSPNDNEVLVLSDSYEADYCLDVRKFRDKLNSNVLEYSKSWNKLMKDCDDIFYQTLQAHEFPFFDLVISPISRWIEAVDKCVVDYDISEIAFTSYTNNNRIFQFEAEGEANTKFLYKTNYYMPYYIRQYIETNYDINVGILKYENRFTIRFKYFFRNFVVFCFIFAKQFLFKLVTFRRNFVKNSTSSEIIISSRAIVQTEFIKNYYAQNKENSVLIINEQSFRLFKHLKHVKKMGLEFIYAEGLIYFSDFTSILKNFFLKLFKIRSHRTVLLDYYSIKMPVSSLLLDLINKELDYIFYATSIKNAMEHLNSKGIKQLVSFEMFTPFPFYLKERIKLPTYQVQTTVLEPKYVPNFVGSDYFYFTNPITFKDFYSLNLPFNNKLKCIPFLKYAGTKRRDIDLSRQLKNIVYYTQPFEFEEEKVLIEYLEDYCNKNQILLTIKPHPRQLGIVSSKFKTTIISQKFVDEESLLKNSDLIITRHSSIGLDAWIYGVPCIFVKLNRNLQNMNIFYAPNDYFGTVKSLVELNEVLSNYDKLMKDFNTHSLYEETSTKELNVKNIFE